MCAPRAVCSKIDLYETPWIERQCRCPSQPEIIYHYKTDKVAPVAASSSSSSSPIQRHIDDFQRNRPQRILDIDLDRHEDNERPYIRDLMKKLGTVYDITDIVLDEDQQRNDYHDYDGAQAVGPHLRRSGQIKNKSRRIDNVIDRIEAKKMRHNHRLQDVPKISGCSAMVGLNDGFTIVDKTRHYKLCEPVQRLPTCRYFRDYTWSLKSDAHENVTEQIVHCKCPRNSVTYLTKRLPGQDGFTYLFACSPQSVSEI